MHEEAVEHPVVLLQEELDRLAVLGVRLERLDAHHRPVELERRLDLVRAVEPPDQHLSSHDHGHARRETRDGGGETRDER